MVGSKYQLKMVNVRLGVRRSNDSNQPSEANLENGASEQRERFVFRWLQHSSRRDRSGSYGCFVSAHTQKLYTHPPLCPIYPLLHQIVELRLLSKTLTLRGH